VEYKIILFDGVCNLCNGIVNYIIDRDKKKVFKFASLQSESATRLLRYHPLQNNLPDSIVLIDNGKLKTKSSAVLEIARNLNGVWPFFYWMIVIPAVIRDLFYDLVAKNRYWMFGRNKQCRIPEPELLERFL
jgi:predicted DCC family thiol-disulfide oxidoreductase YuxK